MATQTCYARFYCALNSDGTPDLNNGHVDLQVNGVDGAVLNYDSYAKNIASPVFSYGGIGGIGYVKIFPFTTTKGADFLKSLQSSMQYSSSTSNYYLYKMNSSHPFYNYSIYKYNAFGATATWCNILGVSYLLEKYEKYTNSFDGYLEYAPWICTRELYKNVQYQYIQ